jgi:hypothetical protein
MERSHDKEVQDAILENRSHQPSHFRLAQLCFVLEDEANDANEGDQICGAV